MTNEQSRRPGEHARGLALEVSRVSQGALLDVDGARDELDWLQGFEAGLSSDIVAAGMSDGWREGCVAGKHLRELCRARDQHIITLERARGLVPVKGRPGLLVDYGHASATSALRSADDEGGDR